MHQLRDPEPRATLLDALIAVGLQYAALCPTEVHGSTSGAPRPLPEMVRDEFYNIGREALLNACQHASAQRIDIELRYDEHALGLTIADDGRGLGESLREERSPEGHFGITGMHERAAQIGASLRINDRAGGGTVVELSLAAALAYTTTPGRLR